MTENHSLSKESYLYSLAITKMMSLTDIAKKENCSIETVRNWLKKHGLYEAWVEAKSISSTHPEVMSEWNYSKNEREGLCPRKLTYGSRKYAHWICKHGHTWSAQIKNRTKKDKTACPDCKNRRASEHYNLQTEYPEIAEQWDYQRNKKTPEEVMPGTEREYYWICPKGHPFKNSVLSRTRSFYSLDSGCRRCRRKQKTSYPEQTILFYLKDALKSCGVKGTKGLEVAGERTVEADIFIESLNLAIEYDGFYYHHDKTEYDSEKSKSLSDCGYRVLRILETGLSVPLFCDHIYHVVDSSYNSLDSTVKKTILYIKRHFRDKLTKEQRIHMDEVMGRVNHQKDRLRILRGWVYQVGERSLKRNFPSLASEWNHEKNEGLLPEEFSYGSKQVVWWRCPNNHEWKTSINSRTNSPNLGECYECRLKRESLGQLYPESLNEWDYERNKITPYEIFANTHEKYWFVSRFDEKELYTTPASRVSGYKRERTKIKK